MTNAENQARRIRDFDLVQRSLQGDDRAWDTLYNGAYDVVLRKVRSGNREKVLTQEDMQEITEEALFRSYKKRKEFRAVSLFSTWACGFAAYVALEYKRKRYNQLAREYIYSYDPPADWTDMDAYLIRKERDFYLWLAYDSLTYNQRILIAWRVLKWYDQKEAQRLTGIRKQDMDAKCDKAVEVYSKRFHAVYRG